MAIPASVRALPLAPRANRLAFDLSSTRTYDEDGHMHVADCPISRATVNDYYGEEIPGWKELGLKPKQIYRLLRDPEELARGAATFDNKQLLDEHLETTADDNKKSNVAGVVGRGCYFDGEFLRTPQLTIHDQKDIDGVEKDEKRELSASYGYDAVMEPGVYNGLRYDGRMVNIVGNHVALVPRGRAGRDVRVNDALPKGLRMKKKAFDRFVRKASRLLANDADISTEELVDLVTAVAADPDAAEDDELNTDPNAVDEELDEDGKPKKKAEDEEDEDEDETDEDKKKRKKAEDAALIAAGLTPRRPKPARRAPAMDADAIRSQVVRELGQWDTAKRKVERHIGTVRVAMDALPGGAAGLYRKALESHKVSHKGITELAALEGMVDMLPDPSATRRIAMDAAPAGEVSPLDGIVPDNHRIVRS